MVISEVIVFVVALVIPMVTFFGVKYQRSHRSSKTAELSDLKEIRKDLKEIVALLQHIRDQVTP